MDSDLGYEPLVVVRTLSPPGVLQLEFGLGVSAGLLKREGGEAVSSWVERTCRRRLLRSDGFLIRKRHSTDEKKSR
jgi:hypothetical protein